METSKIKKFNPSLFKDGVTPPSMDNPGMKKATWLLDTTKWEGLKESYKDTELYNYINYIVGAPSLELLIDSYNARYGLTGDSPNTSLDTTTNSDRTKLFYKYQNNSNGYLVGPNYQKKKQFSDYTSNYSFKSDSELDPLYYPIADSGTCSYYIASPANNSKNQIMRVLNNNGGFISYCPSDTTINVFCPIISISANCQIKFGD